MFKVKSQFYKKKKYKTKIKVFIYYNLTFMFFIQKHN